MFVFTILIITMVVVTYYLHFINEFLNLRPRSYTRSFFTNKEQVVYSVIPTVMWYLMLIKVIEDVEKELESKQH